MSPPDPPRSLPARVLLRIRARIRLVAALAAALLAFFALPRQLSDSTRALLTWDLSAALYLALTWSLMLRASLPRTRWGARIQRDGAVMVLSLTVAAAVASLAAILIELSGLNALPAEQQDLHIVLVVATLLVSWLLTHTAFASHYASNFYAASDPRGNGSLEFPHARPPVHMDFLYFALVVGMTSQTSDVAVTTTAMRRLVSFHSMIAFFFNTALLALTINIAGSILD